MSKHTLILVFMTILLACLMALSVSAEPAVDTVPTAATSPATSAFEVLKKLEGRWTGTSAGGAAIEVDYIVTGGGTALMERYRMGDHGEMLTVYHLDGDSILLTHYCSVGNQPRMRVTDFDKEGTYRFDFVDVSGALQDGHMHHALVRYDGGDSMSSDWTYRQGGEDQFTETATIHRVR